MSKQKVRHTRLSVLEAIFSENFSEGGSQVADVRGEHLIPFLLKEAARAAGVRKSDQYLTCEKYRDARALKAAQLLAELPVATGAFNNGDCPSELVKTRSLLWGEIILGMRYGSDENRPKHMKAFLSPVKRLSRDEVRALKDCVRKHLQDFGEYGHTKLYQEFRVSDGPYGKDALRALLGTFVLHGNINVLLGDLMPSDNNSDVV